MATETAACALAIGAKPVRPFASSMSAHYGLFRLTEKATFNESFSRRGIKRSILYWLKSCAPQKQA